MQKKLQWFSEADIAFDESIGIHGKYLATLWQKHFPISPGFILTSEAYTSFLKENNLDHKIKQLLSTVAIDRPESLMQAEMHIRTLFEKAVLPQALSDAISNAYVQLGDRVMVQTYTTGKETSKHFTNTIDNKMHLLLTVKDAWAAMFSAHALWQRHHQGIDHWKTHAVVIVTKAVRDDISGTIYTVDPLSHQKDSMIIITKHPHPGDRYTLSKKHLSILERQLKHTTNIQKLTMEELMTIAETAKRLEQHLYFPQEISWSFSHGRFYITTSKPITTLPTMQPEKKRKLSVARGIGLTKTIGTGVAHVITNDIIVVNDHDVLIAREIKPHMIKHIKKARAILSEMNHPHTEVAVQLKQLGIPTVINVKDATKRFRNGHILTVHAGKGEIYRG